MYHQKNIKRMNHLIEAIDKDRLKEQISQSIQGRRKDLQGMLNRIWTQSCSLNGGAKYRGRIKMKAETAIEATVKDMRDSRENNKG